MTLNQAIRKMLDLANEKIVLAIELAQTLAVYAAEEEAKKLISLGNAQDLAVKLGEDWKDMDEAQRGATAGQKIAKQLKELSAMKEAARKARISSPEQAIKACAWEEKELN